MIHDDIAPQMIHDSVAPHLLWQAVDLAESLRPDLVIMDVKMPRRDGIDAAAEIAAKRIAPIVVLTAFALLLDALVGVIEKRLMVWQPKTAQSERL